MDTTIEVSKTIANDAGTFRAVVLGDPGMSQAMASPREESDTHLGVMVAAYPFYSLPHEDGPVTGAHVKEAVSGHDFRVVRRWLRMFHGARVVLPIYSSGGSDLRLVAGDGAEGEDATAGNYIGVIYDTPKTREGENVSEAETIRWLRLEVAAYDAWANGEMTGYQVQRLTGEDEEADEAWELVDEDAAESGGYFSVEEAREQAVVVLGEVAGAALHTQALAENAMYDLHTQALTENAERDAWTTGRRAAERALAVIRKLGGEAAAFKLDHFGLRTLGSETLRDLVSDLYHLAYRNGIHPEMVHRSAVNDWFEETTDEDTEVYVQACEDSVN